MFDQSQLMRGTLEGCILSIIGRDTTYGYEILQYLKSNGFSGLTEGTIYPLLLRLESLGYISSELRLSPLGPKRKYYSITDKGRDYLAEFTSSWRKIQHSVNNILEGEE